VTDWSEWHTRYDDPGGRLARRLAAVQEQLRTALDRAAHGPLRLLALCAGEGRDVLPVLRAHPRGTDVRARLVEIDVRLCAVARAAAPAGVEVVQGDAGSAAFAGAVPVDVLMLCGIFGNTSDTDVERTVSAVPSLLATGGTVIWTRHTRPPDLSGAVRGWFAAAGVEETAFGTGEGAWSVGAGVLRGPMQPLDPAAQLFRFTGRRP
jgi:hypothetical protein